MWAAERFFAEKRQRFPSFPHRLSAARAQPVGAVLFQAEFYRAKMLV